MRYVYSVVRFVPDPVRGEFVNVGLLVGSDESSEWRLRAVTNAKRARALDEKGLLPLVLGFVDDVGRKLDAYEDLVELGLNRIPSGQEVSELWLTRLWQESRNVVQLSPPSVISAETADAAMQILFEEFILESEARRYQFQKKHPALAAVRRVYRDNGLRKGEHWGEGATVRGRNHRERFDFVVGNGRAFQLAHTWSFQVPAQDELAEQVKAWAFTVEDIRSNGGEAELEHRRVEVPRGVDVAVVYVPPAEGGPRGTLKEALAAFEKVDAQAVPTTEVQAVGARAAQLALQH